LGVSKRGNNSLKIVNFLCILLVCFFFGAS
jgi:hypothetical protein